MDHIVWNSDSPFPSTVFLPRAIDAFTPGGLLVPSSASEVLLSVALEVADCAPLSKNQFCGQNKNAPIDFGTVGGGLNGNGSSESTLQTQFVSGLPHDNQSEHGAESV